MQSTWTLKEKSLGEMTVTIDGELWKTAQDKALKLLIKEVEIKGFRKGQVPFDMAKKAINPKNVLIEAAEKSANDAYVFGLKEQNLEPLSKSQLDILAMTETEVTLKFTFVVKPEIVLGQYKDLGIKKAKVKVTAKEVDAKVEEVRQQFAELVIKENGVVELNDTAVIDFVGFRDGIEFEGGKGDNYGLEIGSNSFIPGFEEAMIGMHEGEEKDIEITFPENYQQADMAGQKVTFKVKVNEVKIKQLPEANDEFAKSINHHDAETMEALREHYELHLKEDKMKQADEDYANAVLTKVVDAVTVDIPEVLVEEEMLRMFDDFIRRLKEQGFSMEQYTDFTGQTADTLKDQMRIDAKSKVKVRLVLDAVADAEKMSVSEEDIEAEYIDIAVQNKMDAVQVKEIIAPEVIAYDLRLRKAYELVLK